MVTGRVVHRRRAGSPTCSPTCPVALLAAQPRTPLDDARPLRRLGAAARAGPARRVGDDASSPMAPRRRRLVDPRPAPVPDGEVDYGYLVDDADDAAARPAVAAPARRACTGGRAPSTPTAYAWTDDAWTGRQLAGSVIYELHVGTFTPEGTLDAALGRLDHLRVDRRRLRRADAGQRLQRHPQLGLRRRAVVRRPRAVRRPGGLPALRRRLPRGRARRDPGRRPQPPRPVGQLPAAVRALPQGRAPTPGATWSTSTARAAHEVRRYILDSVRMWFDRLPRRRAAARRRARARPTTPTVHLLEEMAVEVAALSAHLRRPLTLIAESDLNDPLLVTPREAGGYGLDAQWSDDFHHAVHVALTGETDGYYADFEPLVRAGQGVRARASSTTARSRSFRGRDHGVPIDTDADARPGGWWSAARTTTRSATAPRGDRLTEALDDDQLACAALLTLAVAVHADAVPGRGVGGLDAVPVLHLPPRAGARPGHRRGPDRGVRADGLGPGRRARPAGPRDVRALQAGLGRARHRPARACCSRPTGGWPRCAARCPSSPTRPSRRSTCTVDEDARTLVMRRGAVSGRGQRRGRPGDGRAAGGARGALHDAGRRLAGRRRPRAAGARRRAGASYALNPHTPVGVPGWPQGRTRWVDRPA